MDLIRLKAYGKVNLGLDVTGQRADGYHLVRMIMQTVDVWDEITVSKTVKMPDSQDGTASEGIFLTCDRPEIPTDQSNLAYRAAALVFERYGLDQSRENVHIHIEKHIPMAAGMAGGSADGAAVIRALDELFGLSMTDEEKDEIAEHLGADVPFCLRRGTWLAEGIGEVLTGLPDIPHCSMILLKPEFSVSTPWAYRELDAYCRKHESDTLHPDIDGLIQAIREGSVRHMAERMGNILEPPVAARYPQIVELEQQLKGLGALTAMMSGSGPTVFGIFEEKKTAERAFTSLRGGKYGQFKVEF